MQGFVERLRELARTDILQYEYFGNTVGDFVLAGIALIVFLVVFKIAEWLLLRRLQRIAERTATDVDDTVVAIVRTLKPPFYFFISLYLAVRIFVALDEVVLKFFNAVLVIWIVYQAISAVQVLIDFVVRRAMGGEDNPEARVAADIIGKISKILLWVVGGLLVLSNLGVNVTSLIAGLGIGGIAVAFALQNILSDLFSSFAIYFDKPFVAGDFIVIGESKGTVERIGIKTTRLRTLQGEELIISNQELTSERVQNFKKLEERRVVFEFGVVYETLTELLRAIPDMIQDIIGDIESIRFDRAHFTRFDDSALVFEVVYFVESAEYGVYIDAQQEINIRIKDAFEARGIAMPYSTHTVYIAGDTNG